MSDFDWTERFPDMRPVRNPPALVRINGIGCGVYGSRDHDADTGTYITTYCFSVVFIPVLALTAYRIADADNGGWYFLGRVPLSPLAKSWNLLVLFAGLCVAGLIGWTTYTESPDYRAGRTLAEADALADNGALTQAAQRYSDVATGSSSHKADAAARLNGLLDDPRTHTSLTEAAGVFRVAISSRRRTGGSVGDLEERGLKLFDQHGETEPRGALALLDVLTPVAGDPHKLVARRRSLLERVVARDPGNPQTVSELALLYEETNELPRCEALLMPLKNRLGDSEGARILGTILRRQDKVEEACAVLEPYTTRRLPQLRSAKQAFENALNQLNNQIKGGFAPGFPYQRLEKADKASQSAIYQEYVASRIKEDANLKNANETYQRARLVVPAALDLGIVLLRRAQSRPDLAAREADLKKAEEMFLAIQTDETAKSNAYRLSLGQVYYWLGKHQEGRKQFDEALAADHDSPAMLAAVAELLHEVGADAEARPLFEKAYNTEADAEKKSQAAVSRALAGTDLDDKILWLQRANTKAANAKAILRQAQADKALQEGKPAEAEPHLRAAIDLYSQLPENAATLNNSGLAHLTLYRISGDRKSLEQGEAMLEKAVAQSPRDSTLLFNAAHALLDAAVRDVIGNAIDLKMLKKSGEHSLLSYLYDDRDGQRRILERLGKHPAAVKATSMLEHLRILAPKNAEVYHLLVTLYEDQRNEKALRGLVQQLDKVEPDLSARQKRLREMYAGKTEDKDRKNWTVERERCAKLVEITGKGQRGITYAVAATELAAVKMALAQLGDPVDAEEVVALAESAQKAAPSSATRGMLEFVLLYRASRSLERKEPAFAALASRTRRSLSVIDVLAVVMGRDGKMRQAALADADVQRVFPLIRESCRKFPDTPKEWAWAMLRGVDADESARLAKHIQENALNSLVRTIEMKLSPLKTNAVLHVCWALQAAGKDKEVAGILKECAARGMSMPDAP